MAERTNLTVDVEDGTDEVAPATGRRLLRWATVLVVGILAVLAVWQDSLS